MASTLDSTRAAPGQSCRHRGVGPSAGSVRRGGPDGMAERRGELDFRVAGGCAATAGTDVPFPRIQARGSSARVLETAQAFFLVERFRQLREKPPALPRIGHGRTPRTASAARRPETIAPWIDALSRWSPRGDRHQSPHQVVDPSRPQPVEAPARGRRVRPEINTRTVRAPFLGQRAATLTLVGCAHRG